METVNRPNAVEIEDVSKTFRLYRDRNQSLKATVLRGRRAKFEEFWALKNVTFDIPQGTTFGLMGHNGSGKSTLLKCIAGILTPQTGEVRSRGRMAAMLEVGSGFHPELTGIENIYLNGSILGMSRKEIDRKLDDIVDFAGVGDFIEEPVKNYSSGMYVRLGFSVSIHVDPDILLVDEILAVGDMQFQDKCKEKFAEIKHAGKTVVLVSHGLGDMRSFCDTAAWLDHGQLVEIGPASRIVDHYIDAGHDARAVEGGGTRFGSGEATIHRVEMLSREGVDSRTFATGEPWTIRLHFKADKRIERPVFGVSLAAMAGEYVWAYHSLDGGYVPDYIEGEGSIDISVDRLPLQPGTFDLSVSLVDYSTTHEFDHWRNAARMDVLAGVPFESGGLVVMNSRYQNLQPPRPIEPPIPRGELFRAEQERRTAEREASETADAEAVEANQATVSPSDASGATPGKSGA